MNERPRRTLLLRGAYVLWLGLLPALGLVGCKLDVGPGVVPEEEVAGVEGPLGVLKPVPELDEDSLASLDDTARQRIQEAYLDVRQTAVVEENRELLLDAYGDLGKLLMAFGFRDLALPAFENAETLAPDEVEWIYLQGLIHLRAQRFEEAIERFEAARSLATAMPIILIRMAEAYLAMEDLDQARDHVEVALIMEPEMARGHEMMGEILADQGSTENAIKFIERALELQPSADRLYFVLSELYESLGREELADAYRARRGSNSTAVRDPWLMDVDRYQLGTTAIAQRAKLLMEQGRWREAVRAYESVVQEDPESADGYLGLGAARLQQNDLAGAKEALNRALELDASLGSAHFNLAMIDLKIGRDEAAEAGLREALELSPNNPEATFQLAQLLRRTERCDEAVPLYERALENEPKAHPVRLQTALCLRDIGDDARALEVIETGARIFPDEALLGDALARLLSTIESPELRDPARAIEIAEALLEENYIPEYLDVLAMAQAANGDYDAAVATVDEALSLGRAAGAPERMIAHLEANRAQYRSGSPTAQTWPAWLMTTR